MSAALLVAMLLSADGGVEVALVPLTPGWKEPPRAVRWTAGPFTVTNDEARRSWKMTSAKGAVLAQGPEVAAGAVAFEKGALIAVFTPDATSGDAVKQLRAFAAMERGDTATVEALAGPQHAALLTVRADGTVANREPLALRPEGLAFTANGWLVLLSMGTAANAFRDGALLGRAPGARSGWKVLASGLQSPGQVTARGPWVCVSELPGMDDRVAHCVDPTRGLWLKSPALQGNLFLRDVDLAGKRGLVLLHQRYVKNAPVDGWLTLPLP